MQFIIWQILYVLQVGVFLAQCKGQTFFILKRAISLPLRF